MSAFSKCSDIEAEGMKHVLPFIASRSERFVITNKGRLSLELQKRYGDLFLNSSSGEIWSVEVKTEQGNKHNNLFLEVWSNRSRDTLGWMHNLNCDILLYFFLDEMDLYSIRMPRLQDWFFSEQERFPLKRQNKYDQKNDTWGRCVPISVIGQEVGYNRYYLGDMRIAA